MQLMPPRPNKRLALGKSQHGAPCKRILGRGQAGDAGQEKTGRDTVTRFQGVNHNLTGTPIQNQSWPNHPLSAMGRQSPHFVQFQELKQKAQARLPELLADLARPERFELPTTWFVARYSIQLSYGRVSGDADYAD